MYGESITSNLKKRKLIRNVVVKASAWSKMISMLKLPLGSA